jgi:hypothetical protein
MHHMYKNAHVNIAFCGVFQYMDYILKSFAKMFKIQENNVSETCVHLFICG